MGLLRSVAPLAGTLLLVLPAGAQVTIVNMVPRSSSDEANQDSEPSLTVHPTNPDLMFASAFTPNGQNPYAVVYMSSDGGRSWEKRAIVPSSAQNHRSGTGDITLQLTENALYAGILRNTDDMVPNKASLLLNAVRTTDLTGRTPMQVMDSKYPTDQPHMRGYTVPTGPDAGFDRLYLGINDLSKEGTGYNTSTVFVSAAGSLGNGMLTESGIDPVVDFRRNGPPVRTAHHPDGTVYATYFHWDSYFGNRAMVDVVIVRDDHGGLGATPFQGLKGSAGVRIRSNLSVLTSAGPSMGSGRLVNSDLSVAVDPRDSSIVYVAFAAGSSVPDYGIGVFLSNDSGLTWAQLGNDRLRAKAPALAVNATGEVGLLYQELRPHHSQMRWRTRFEVMQVDTKTRQLTGTHTHTLGAFPEQGAPAIQFSPYLGDYVGALAVGKDFRGVFSTSNDPAHMRQGVVMQRNWLPATQKLLGVNNVTVIAPSIDPYYFELVTQPHEEEFHVRDWTEGPTKHDRGLGPSVHAGSLDSSDVWNRTSDDPGGFDALGRPQGQHQVFLGTNYAFARVHRRQAGPARNVSVDFLVADFGVGGNYRRAGTALSPVLHFPASSTVETMTAGYPWFTGLTSSHHTLAVEISTPDDPVASSLLGRAPATPTQCGWINDPFGLSWQIVPRRFTELVADEDPKKVQAVMDAMLAMQKLDVATLERAYDEA